MPRPLLVFSGSTPDKAIHHFHIDHNVPCLPTHPPQKKDICITIDLDFSWDNWYTQEKLETMVMQNLGGGGGGEKQEALWSMWK